MFKINNLDSGNPYEVVDEGRRIDFYYQGIYYTAYERIYGDESVDIEVQYALDIGEDVSGEVQEYAESLFERL